jgi:hypothetical protein
MEEERSFAFAGEGIRLGPGRATAPGSVLSAEGCRWGWGTAGRAATQKLVAFDDVVVEVRKVPEEIWSNVLCFG